MKPNLLKTADAHSPVVTPWQCQWATCDPQAALPLLGSPACLGQSKPTASTSGEIAKIQVAPIYLEAEISLKFQAMFMAGVGHSQVGPPPTWTQNLCHYSNKATPSRVTSCLKPNLLETAEAHSPCGPQVALPWRPSLLGEVKTHSLQLC